MVDFEDPRIRLARELASLAEEMIDAAAALDYTPLPFDFEVEKAAWILHMRETIAEIEKLAPETLVKFSCVVQHPTENLLPDCAVSHGEETYEVVMQAGQALTDIKECLGLVEEIVSLSELQNEFRGEKIPIAAVGVLI